MKLGTLLESSRVRSPTRERFEKFYKDLRQFIADKNIKPRYITNMDEHEIQEQETAAGKVIGDSLTARALVQSSDPTPWVTIIEAVTVKARRLTPVVNLYQCVVARPMVSGILQKG